MKLTAVQKKAIARGAALALILVGIGWYLEHEQREGRFQEADNQFLDFLLANSRERFKGGDGPETEDVVFVRMREEDRADYGDWPPQPLDWQMLLKGLAAFQPDVLVIPDALAWGAKAPEFIPQTAQALIPYPSVVLGVHVAAGTGGPGPQQEGIEAFARESFPGINRIDGHADLLPEINSILAVPDETIRRQMELGVVLARTDESGAVSVPVAARSGQTVVPSLLLQTLARHSRTPYARQRMRVGAGAGAHLGEGIYVPLEVDGSFAVSTDGEVPAVSALNLITGGLADALSAEDKAKLGANRVVVIGIDRDSGGMTPARLQALALRQALSLPRIRQMERHEQWIVYGLVGLLGLGLLKFERGKAVKWALAAAFAVGVVSFVAFQSSLVWCPPAIPGALLAVSTLYVLAIGKPKEVRKSPKIKLVQARTANAV